MVNLTGINHVAKDKRKLVIVFDSDKLYLQKRPELWKSGIRVQRELNSQASNFVDSTFASLVNNAISNKIKNKQDGTIYSGICTNLLTLLRSLSIFVN